MYETFGCFKLVVMSLLQRGLSSPASGEGCSQAEARRQAAEVAKGCSLSNLAVFRHWPVAQLRVFYLTSLCQICINFPRVDVNNSTVDCAHFE